MNNLKQVGLGVMMYAGDYDGYAPLRLDSGGSISWAYNLSLLGYITNADVFTCPSYPPYKHLNWTQVYGIRENGTSVTVSSPIRILHLDNLSDYPYVFDTLHTTNLYQYNCVHLESGNWPPNTVRAHLRHSGTANTLFADGSVRSLNKSQLITYGFAEDKIQE